MSTLTDARETLRTVFGFPEFLRGQERVIEKLLAEQSVLAIFPTGAGKSLCYQLPALHLEGVTLVISPLIALMKDQIDFLIAKGVAAARLDSSLPHEESRTVLGRLRSGELKLLYIAPERLSSERFLETLRKLEVSLLAVDEAHCISEWGHNFRPDYLKLAALARELDVGRVLALTATATPEVASDIAGAFGISQESIVQTGFHRPNLILEITPAPLADRKGILLERMRSRPRAPAVVYVSLQRTAEEVAEFLGTQGFAARAYHAGMEPEVRHEIQDWFMASREAVVVATIAFGMGIDKSDIRAVYHYNLPKSLENYAQEIGRAGRDGKESVCELLVSEEDLVVLENFIYGDTPDPEAVAGLLREILEAPERFDISIHELSGKHDIRPLVVETILTYLEMEGLLRSTGPFYTEYRFQENAPIEEICRRFDSRRADFLLRLFGTAVRGRSWSRLDLHAAADTLAEPRERMVAALNYLEEKGDLILKPAGVRRGYRRLASGAERERLLGSMAERFLGRERRDLARLHEVLRLARHEGCWTRRLLDYFGEALGKDCGHCGWCRGRRPGTIPTLPPADPGPAEAALLRSLNAEGHEALRSPRQAARFLCGLASPQSSRARLQRHPLFGRFREVPFRTIFAFTEAARTP